nr:MAG TPA: chromosome segregation ATPase [Caudoviricetes sp.]
MPTVCKITLDAAEYKKELNDVVARSKAAQTELSKNSVQGTQAAGKAADQFGQKISKAGGIMSAFGSQAGGKFSGLGQVIGSLGSPITLITTAVGALTAVTMDFLRKGISGAQEAADAAQKNAEAIRESAAAAEQQRQKNEANWKSLKSLKDSLDILSVTEKASNAQKTEAVRLIGLLSKSYGDLGISIDEATGRMQGFDKAYAAALEKDRQNRLNAMKGEYKELESEIARNNEIIGGFWSSKNDVANAQGNIQNATKRMAELAPQIHALEKSNPGKDYTTAAKSAELDRKQNTFDSAYDQLKNEEQQLKYQQLINEGRIKEANALKLINDAKKQGMELEKSDAEWIAERQGRVRMDSYYENEMDSLATKKREQELINAGLDEEAEKLRIIMELEKQGAEVSDDKVDKIMHERRELKSMQLAYGLKEQAYGLQNQAMHKVGLGKEADEQKALRDAEKQKGAKLDENETALVKSIADLTYKMGHETLPQLGDLSIKTNSLTSRGGFASGAVMPDKDAVNKAVARFNQTQCQLLENIKGLIGKLNTTVEKSGKV